MQGIFGNFDERKRKNQANSDFESVTSTIPSHRLLKNAAEESAAALELDARFELATS